VDNKGSSVGVEDGFNVGLVEGRFNGVSETVFKGFKVGIVEGVVDNPLVGENEGIIEGGFVMDSLGTKVV
jgi:hypothetical protein